MKKLPWYSLTVLLVSGCLLTGILPPKIIHHPAPTVQMDFTPFEDAGCPPDEYGYNRICAEDSELNTLGCDRLYLLPAELGSLSPSMPMAGCLFIPIHHDEIAEPWIAPEGDYIYDQGGPYLELMRYVAAVDGGFKLIKNADEFRAVFAPVDSAEEALAFALALVEVYSKYDQEYNLKYRYEVRTLEDTFVESNGDGYLVHLFDYQFFGCGPHYYYAVDLQVTPDGYVSEVSRTKIYRDPGMDGLCQD